jgi:histidine ammonia-lyase
LSNSYKIDGQKEGLAIINQNQESANMAALPITDQTAIDKWYYITLA